jgi:hypothetical protein
VSGTETIDIRSNGAAAPGTAGLHVEPMLHVPLPPPPPPPPPAPAPEPLVAAAPVAAAAPAPVAAPPVGGMLPSIVVLGRHRAVLLAGLGLTALVAVVLGLVSPPRQTASGTLLLLPPAPRATAPGTDPTVDLTNNPYLRIGKLGTVGEVLATVMSSQEVAGEVEHRGGFGTYAIGMAPSDAPIVRVDVTGGSPGEALDTYKAVSEVVRARLMKMQIDQGAPPELAVRAMPVTSPSTATGDSGSTVRVIIVTVVLGLAATVLLVFALESLAEHRRSRPRESGVDG